MNEKQPTTNPPGINLTDIYHVLFRHKGKILIVWGLGLAVAIGLKLAWPVAYESQAKLYIRYVLDNKSFGHSGSDANIQTPDSGGPGIINSEVQMLNSFDLALEVAKTIGPTNILQKSRTQEIDQTVLLNQAALSIQRGLSVEPIDKTPVITLVFDHPERDIVQPVLNQLIASYIQMHIHVHQTGATMDEQLRRQADDLKAKMEQTEEALRQAKSQIGIVSLEDTKKAYTEQVAKITQDLDDTKAELAEHQVSIIGFTNALSAAPQTNSSIQPSTSADKVAQYAQVTGLLDTLGRTLQDRLLHYKPESASVQEIQQQIADNQKIKEQLEKDYPLLVRPAETIASDNGHQVILPQNDWFTERKRIGELESRVRIRNEQLDSVRKQMAALIDAEGTITDLEIKKADLDRKYTQLSTRLNDAQYDEALGPGRVSNISTIEEPVPPLKAQTKLQKILLMVLAGSFAAGVALAFGIELYVDRSFKRAIEIESSLHLPLFLSIPKVGANGMQLLSAGTRRLLAWSPPGKKAANGGAISQAENTEPAPWSHNHSLRPFFEALRDRLIVSFEARNVTRNPKLVAVTSCAEGAGASTVASGLAACLSETGDGNVLLVDMNSVGPGAAQYFRQGKLELGLDDALKKETRGDALVQENLYVVAETPGNGQISEILHKRFSSLMPKLKASDYDYIIFDMPPVSQISPAPKLARFMDMVFMVVEAEKTDRSTVKHATDLLAESKTHVGIVLNKERNYIPRWIRQGS